MTWNQAGHTKTGWGWCNLSVKKGMLNIIPTSAFSDALSIKGFKGRKVYDSSISVRHEHPLRSLKLSFRKATTYGRAYRSVESLRSIPDVKDFFGVQVWKELHPDISLPRWVFLRLFGFRLGEMWGMIRGGLVGR